MSKRAARLAAAAAIATGVVAGGGITMAHAAAAPTAIVGTWQYIAIAEQGLDWTVSVTDNGDGTFTGTVVSSNRTTGPCVPGGVVWRNLTVGPYDSWPGEQVDCNGDGTASVPTRLSLSESSDLNQWTGEVRWQLRRVP